MKTQAVRIDRRPLAVMAALAATFVLMAMLLLAHPASAQSYPVNSTPTPSDPNQVLGTKFTRGQSSAGLPITGGDVVGLTILGLGLIGTGAVVLRVRRHTLPA
jgi:LPXTG-motif cell wall-anchored protein